jgi:transketolase
MTDQSPSIEEKCVNTIRALSMDAVQKANSGHPGTPMALAPLAHVLYTRVLRHDPTNPDWFNRDRFVLSAGHASMLLYSILHLTGYDISLDDIKEFRQWGSKTPGHPEVHHTAGVEVTTGPLGQGFANAVGMAIAEEYLRNLHGSDVINHHIYVLCSDGDLMEGISYEAASLAGHNKLSHLVAIYDDNKITIDGSTDLSFSENVADRFRAQGWNVIEAGEIAEDLDALESTLNQAKANTDAPTMIVLRSHIGYPSPQFTDTSAAHGSPLGQEEVDVTKNIMGISDEPFYVDNDVATFYKEKKDRFASESRATKITSPISTDAKAWLEKSLKEELTTYFDEAPKNGDAIATRVSCAQILSKIAEHYDALIGGSADLTGNTGTKVSSADVFSASSRGKQIHYGIREHAMAASAVSMALSYDLRPFVGTFFVFSDYMRPSLRLASITNAPALFVFSHDSVGVGEDGPTHQPIEHLASLRAMPQMQVVRPADGYETAAAIEYHLARADGPTALILTRQNVPTLENTLERARDGVAKGAYVVVDSDSPDVVLVSTGSEVHLCVEAAEKLKQSSINVRVVSMPCMDRYLQLSESEKTALFPQGVPVLSVEAATSFGWAEIADEHVSIDRFGASAPGGLVFEKLGINVDNIVNKATALASH